MPNVLIRLGVAIFMELILALVAAPFYMQIFPLVLFGWIVYDMVIHTKIIKIQTPLNLPKDLQKQLEKHAKKQIKDIEKKLRNNGKTETEDEGKK